MGLERGPGVSTASVLVWLILVFSLARVCHTAGNSAAPDFYQFWVVGQAVGTLDVSDIYSDDNRRRLGRLFLERFKQSGESPRALQTARGFRQTLGTYSTPFLYSCLHLLTTGRYDLDLVIFFTLSMASLLFGIAMFCRAFGHRGLVAVAAAAFYVGCAEPMNSELRVGNVNCLQFGILGAWLWVETRPGSTITAVMAGAILGFGVIFKPNTLPAVGLLFLGWLQAREYGKFHAHALGYGIATAAAFAQSSVFFGTVQCWKQWLSAAGNIPEDIVRMDKGNYALAGVVNEWTGIGSYVLVTLLLVLTLVATAKNLSAERRGARLQDSDEDLKSSLVRDTKIMALGCLVYLLSGELVWLHYYLLTIPISLWLLQGLSEPDNRLAAGRDYPNPPPSEASQDATRSRGTASRDLAQREAATGDDCDPVRRGSSGPGPGAISPRSTGEKVLTVVAIFGVNFGPLKYLPIDWGDRVCELSISLSTLVLYGLGLWDLYRCRGGGRGNTCDLRRNAPDLVVTPANPVSRSGAGTGVQKT